MSHRDNEANEKHGHDDCCHDGHDHPKTSKSSAPHAAVAPASGLRSHFRIEQMDCPTEEALIRKKLGGMSEVVALDFNLMQRLLTVDHVQGAVPLIEDAIRQLGMTPAPVSAQPAKRPVAAAGDAVSKQLPLIVAAGLAFASEVMHWAQMPEWAAAACAIGAVALSGIGAFRKGLIALKNRVLNINALMTVAVSGALVIRQWPEAAMVMVLFSLAELIEAKALDRARNAIGGLLQLAPERATVKRPDGTWSEIDAKLVAIGDTIRIKPGERIPLDGSVTEGRSTVDQAPITGESQPVDKAAGDGVFAGTINGAGELTVRVTAASNETTLARIIRAVEEAQGQRAPSQRFVDRFAKIYTPAVFVAALAIAIVPPLLSSATWFEWAYRALVLLVIACPCALVISTPVTIVSGLAAAARHGILIKGGVYLEEGRNLRWLALDKTGTITHGRPAQTDFVPWNGGDAATSRRIAVSLAARSDHPVSRALATAGTADAITPFGVEEFSAIAGRGVAGKVGGKLYRLGNHNFMEELGVCSPALETCLGAFERDGKTTIALTDGAVVLAVFAVADTVRGSSRDAIQMLHSLNVKTLMLTGDNEHTASAIARQVGIDEAHGDLLPAAKASILASKQAGGEAVGMVGDGINDAPALASADIGFAMGAAGSDAAIETADVALMDDDLRKLPVFLRLSRATHAVLVQNIAVALVIKAAFLGLTVFGHGSMWAAVFADMGASLIVVFNGLRLLSFE